MRTIGTALFLLLALSGLFGCGGNDAGGKSEKKAPMTWAEAVALNARGITAMERHRPADALPIFREMVDRGPLLLAARFNLAIALLNVQDNDFKVREGQMTECRETLESLAREHPDEAAPVYVLGVLLDHLGEDRALVRAAFERAYALAPRDPDCAYRLGKILFEERPPQLDKAVELLRAALERQPHFIGAWNTLALTLRRLKEPDQAQAANEMFQLFQNHRPAMGRTLELVYGQMGRLATVMRDIPPFGDAPARPPEVAIAFERGPAGLDVASGGRAPLSAATEIPAGSPLRVAQIAASRGLLAGALALADVDGDGDLDLHVADGLGMGRLFRRDGDRFVEITAESGLAPEKEDSFAAFSSSACDLDHDDDLDLVLCGAGRTRVAWNDGRGHFKVAAIGLREDAVCAEVTAADCDHDGDLDLVEAGFQELAPGGAVASQALRYPDAMTAATDALLNNDRPTLYDLQDGSPAPREPFRDIGAQTKVAAATARTVGALAIDVDRDGDLDLFLAEDGAPNRLLLNDRLWRYREAGAAWGLDDAGPARAAASADLDQDGFPDIVLSRGAETAAVILRNRGGEGFTADSVSLPFARMVALADLDLDGDPDFVAIDARSGAVVVRRNDGDAGAIGKDFVVDAEARAVSLAIADLDRDGRPDLLVSGADGSVRCHMNRIVTKNHWVKLKLRGKRVISLSEMWSNTFGVGATVEVMARGRRITVDSHAAGGRGDGTAPELLVGLGAADAVDYVRIVWPDLVLQNEGDVAVDGEVVIDEVNRKASSCPVLFKAAADGEGFDFVTDFLGVGGLGFLTGPDSFAPPDPTETVNIGALPERDGRLLLRVVEPMEEVSYLDELKLLVVEHDADVEVATDERLATSLPMPSGKPIAFRGSFLPTAARDQSGEDTLAELLTCDRVYQKGLELDRRFIGYLAREHALELDFDAEAVDRARPGASAPLWLLLDGWVEYPYSHVNFAAWQAGVEARAFSFDARAADGGWKTVLENVGYPAGMTRAMAVDVSALLAQGIGSIRLRTNIEVHVDRVRLAWGLPDTVIDSRTLDFDVAELRHLGYPEERSPDGKEPKLYDYGRILPSIDWKSMSGRYTRYGDVRELLGAADDRYVLMNHGEEIALEVRASRLPALAPGKSRSFFLLTRGWCKDMDPLTACPDTVEPLPSMRQADYPPAPGTELVPDADWLRRYQTRELPATFPMR